MQARVGRRPCVAHRARRRDQWVAHDRIDSAQLAGAAGRRCGELAAGWPVAQPINSLVSLGGHVRLTRQSLTHSLPGMQTGVARMLGVEFPICAFSHCRDVVAAVSNAGGFGVLGAVAHSPERLKTELSWIEKQTGAKPYGVDLLLPPKYVGADLGGINGDQVRELLPEEHRVFVNELLIRYGIKPSSGDERRAPGQLNISPRGYEPLLDVAF